MVAQARQCNCAQHWRDPRTLFVPFPNGTDVSSGDNSNGNGGDYCFILAHRVVGDDNDATNITTAAAAAAAATRLPRLPLWPRKSMLAWNIRVVVRLRSLVRGLGG